MRRRLAASVLLLSVCSFAPAQDFPSHPIKVIVPQPPGGGFDLVGRVMADKLTPLLGVPVTVENRPGSGTVVGTDAAAKSTPDGYTLLWGSAALPNIGFNPGLYTRCCLTTSLRDFVPVGLAVEVTAIPLRWRTESAQAERLLEVLTAAREAPGKLTYGSGGNGTGQHVGMAILAYAARTWT